MVGPLWNDAQEFKKWVIIFAVCAVIVTIARSSLEDDAHEKRVIGQLSHVCNVVEGLPPLESTLITRMCQLLDEGGEQQSYFFWFFDSLVPRVLAAGALTVVIVFLSLLYNDKLPTAVGQYIARWIHAPIASRSVQLSLSEVLSYKLDLLLSTYAASKAIALLALTATLVFMGWLGVYAVSPASLGESLWTSIAGSGLDWTFTEDVGEGIALRLIGLAVSVGGMLITALLLGLVSEYISQKVDEMKKGRSAVLESGHTLILGWNEKLFGLIEQICMANESEGGKPIVILAEMDKEQMEEDLRNQDLDYRGSTIICRSGDPMMTADLLKVSVREARSIIVLANHQAKEQSDAHAVRILLSLVVISRQEQKLMGNVVVELCSSDNVELVHLLGGSLVDTIVTNELIGRLMLQCARQSGLGNVLQQLLGYDGNEFYLKNWPQFAGRSFGEALYAFPEAIPIGVKCGATGTLLLNPPDDYAMKADDELLVIAEDDDAYDIAAPYDVSKAGSCPSDYVPPQLAGRFLMIGWRSDMHDMIRVFDSFAHSGSEIVLFSEMPIEKRRDLLVENDFDPDTDLVNCRLVFEEPFTYGSPVVIKKLATLNPLEYTSIMIFGDEGASAAEVAVADSRNLATMLQIRHIQLDTLKDREANKESRWSLFAKDSNIRRSAREQNITKPQCEGNWFEDVTQAVSHTIVVSEILDSKTRTLIDSMGVSEYVMSNEFVSMLLAMISECRDLKSLFNELFQSSEGNDLYIHPARRYIGAGETINFYQLTKRAREKSEIPLGYRLIGSTVPTLNPGNKTECCLSLETIDTVIILACDADH